MKGHKLHHETHKKIEHHIAKHRKTGGKVESDMVGKDDAEEDLMMKPERRNNAPKVEDAAEERKHGGRTKKRHEGKHHEGKHHMGKMHEEKAKHHAGRKPRKSGGSCESNVFSTASHLTPARGRKVEKESEGRDY